MKKLKFYLALIPLLLIFFSCASGGKAVVDTIPRGTGKTVGTAAATASVTEDRKTGKSIDGDTLKYGYIVTGDRKDNSQVKRLAANSITNATDKAYASALYEIIQQARKMGGNALNEVVSTNNRTFDKFKDTETVTVTITAEVIVKK